VADETVEDAQVRGLLLEIRRAGSRARILLLGPPDDPARCERWIRRGVQVYLSCGSTPERIVQAMRHAELEDTVAVDACFQRPILELVDRLQPDEDLSPRELEVLRLASRGLRTEEIAARLHLTAHTVNFHLGNATSKLGVRGRTQAVVRALLLGLIAAVDA
jgi:DNA-binding NarL/FixJ family response regulator